VKILAKPSSPSPPSSDELAPTQLSTRDTKDISTKDISAWKCYQLADSPSETDRLTAGAIAHRDSGGSCRAGRAGSRAGMSGRGGIGVRFGRSTHGRAVSIRRFWLERGKEVMKLGESGKGREGLGLG
jgi:hypothetical protein